MFSCSMFHSTRLPVTPRAAAARNSSSAISRKRRRRCSPQDASGAGKLPDSTASLTNRSSTVCTRLPRSSGVMDSASSGASNAPNRSTCARK